MCVCMCVSVCVRYDTISHTMMDDIPTALLRD